MSSSKHDKVAGRIAKQNGTEYNRGPGADVQSPRRAIEVETAQTVSDASRQLRGYRKPVYVAGANGEATKAALAHYQNTSIGVMSPTGKVLKPSTRGKKGT